MLFSFTGLLARGHSASQRNRVLSMSCSTITPPLQNVASFICRARGSSGMLSTSILFSTEWRTTGSTQLIRGPASCARSSRTDRIEDARLPLPAGVVVSPEQKTIASGARCTKRGYRTVSHSTSEKLPREILSLFTAQDREVNAFTP